MRKVISVLLSIAVLLGYMASFAAPILADLEEDPSSPTQPCAHIFTEWKDTGDTHSQTCTLCGIVNSTNHAWLNETVTLQPTCGTEGKRIVTCLHCQAVKEETISPTGNHTLTDLVPTDDTRHHGTCSECQLEATRPHTFEAGEITQAPTCKDSGNQIMICSGCGYSKTETLPPNDTHTFSALAPVDGSNHTGICTVCNQTLTLPHTWDSGSIKKAATCMEAGEIVYTCTQCHYYREETLEMLTEHSWTKWQFTDDNTHKRICTVCQIEEAGEHSYDTAWSHDENMHFHVCLACGSQKNAKEHFAGPEATDTDPQICLVCQYVITPALNHTHEFAENWLCNETGHWHACSECEIKGEYANHKFDNDCDPDCDECGYQRQTAHKFGEDWVCTEESHYHQCSVCSEIQDESSHTSDGQACTICGKAITAAQQQSAPVNSGGKKKKSFPVWGALVIAGVAALLIPVISFFQREYDD